MFIMMKALCILGIPNQHNIHNLKYSQNNTGNLPSEPSQLSVPATVRLCVGQHRLLQLQATRAAVARAAASHSPTGRRCGSGRWAPLEREARAIRMQELAARRGGFAGELLAWGQRSSAGNPLPGACGQSRGHAARGGTQTSRRLHSIGHDTTSFTNIIKCRTATARWFCFLLRLENNIR